MGISVLADEGRLNLQEDLHKISAWSDRWEMPFNVDKYQVLQAEIINEKFEYEMRGVKLKSVQYVKDLGLGVITASNHKSSQNCIDAHEINLSFLATSLNYAGAASSGLFYIYFLYALALPPLL